MLYTAYRVPRNREKPSLGAACMEADLAIPMGCARVPTLFTVSTPINADLLPSANRAELDRLIRVPGVGQCISNVVENTLAAWTVNRLRLLLA